MTEIDWTTLGKVQDGNHRWRAAFPELSEIYVPGEGDTPLAMIIGDAPGAQEEIKRRPFAGTAGNVLHQLMGLAELYSVSWPGISVANCWLTNVVKFRPPRNRKPTPMEIKAARPWLRAEWVAIGKPLLIIPLGNAAFEAVTGKRISILRLTGEAQTHINRDGVSMVVCPMMHPSLGLRNPALQPLLEQDWTHLGKFLKKYRMLNDNGEVIA